MLHTNGDTGHLREPRGELDRGHDRTVLAPVQPIATTECRLFSRW
jgi:hypothetical protein